MEVIFKKGVSLRRIEQIVKEVGGVAYKIIPENNTGEITLAPGHDKVQTIEDAIKKLNSYQEVEVAYKALLGRPLN